MVYTRPMEETSYKLTLISTSLVLYLWGWIEVNIPSLRTVASIYTDIMFLAMMIGLAAFGGLWCFGVYAWPTLPEIPLHFAVGFAIGVLPYVARILLPMQFIPAYSELPRPLMLLVYGLAVPVAEEACFRGTMLPTLSNLFGKYVGALFSTFLFTLMHWMVFTPSPQALVCIYLLGLLYAVVAHTLRSCTASIIAHMTYSTLLIIG